MNVFGTEVRGAAMIGLASTAGECAACLTPLGALHPEKMLHIELEMHAD